MESPRTTSRIEKTASGCWEYVRGREANGYCRVMLDGKRIGAHRISWSLFCGPLPAGKFVCHRCDNPPCINPEHLFIGTPRENAIDCVEKGRSRSAKLHPLDVKMIRQMIYKGKSFREIGRRYGVHHKTISAIQNNTAWSHV